MTRFIALILSILTTGLLLGATTTAAFAAEGAAYRVTPIAVSAPVSTVVAGETLWRQVGATFVAGKSTSRATIICAQVAKKLGKIESFEANGVAFDADALAKCNEKAR